MDKVGIGSDEYIFGLRWIQGMRHWMHFRQAGLVEAIRVVIPYSRKKATR